MNGADEPGHVARQMRAKAKELKESAEHTADPEERQRLSDRARKLDEQSEQASGMAGGDIYPLE